MKKLIHFVLVALICIAQAASAQTLNFDPEHSVISFKVRHMLGTASGKFTKFTGTIDIDPERPENSSVTATIQAASIDTANATRDKHLRELFEVQQFPTISFRSKSVKRLGENTADVMGDFTMHGVTKPVTLRVKFLGVQGQPGKRTTRWQITTTPLKRSEFRLRWSGPVEAASMIGDDVNIDMQIEAAEAR